MKLGAVLGLKKPAMAMELMSALLAYDFEEIPLQADYARAVLEHMAAVKGVRSMIRPTMSWRSGRKGSISRQTRHM
jgi:hypothetical protein